MSLTVSPVQIVETSDSPLLAARSDWTRQPLGAVALIQNGYAFKSQHFVKAAGKPLIRIRDLFNETTVVGFGGDYDPRYIVRRGDLLVGMDGDFNCALWRGPEALLNQRVCKIVPNESKLDLAFLTHVLPGYLQAIHDVTSSMTVTHLSSRDIAQIPIPVPPLDEQRRIARLISTAFEKLRLSSDRIKAARFLIKRFRQSVLAAACSGRLTADWRTENPDIESSLSGLELKQVTGRHGHRNKKASPQLPDPAVLPPTWCWATLPEVGELSRGKSKQRPRNDPKLYGGKYPFIQTGDVAGSFGAITSYSQTYNEAGLAQSRLWPAGTVCITIAANIAASALLTFPACFPDSVVGLIPDEDIVLPEYVELFIRTARRDLAALAPATAQSNINLAILSKVAVALPPVKEQSEIIRRVREAYAKCASVEAAIHNTSLVLDQVARSILAQALGGKA